MNSRIGLWIGTIIAICLIVCYSTRNTGIFFPKRVEVGECVVTGVNKVLYSTYNHKGYIVDFTYLHKKTKDGKKLGNQYATNNKKEIQGFKKGDTLKIYRKPFSDKKFVIDNKGKERYFQQECILLN